MKKNTIAIGIPFIFGIPIGEGGIPIGEGGIPIGEGGIPIGEGGTRGIGRLVEGIGGTPTTPSSFISRAAGLKPVTDLPLSSLTKWGKPLTSVGASLESLITTLPEAISLASSASAFLQKPQPFIW